MQTYTKHFKIKIKAFWWRLNGTPNHNFKDILKMKWRNMKTALKNETILLDVGLPWPVVGMWNEPGGEWAYANVQCAMYHSKYNDFYFETEHEKEPLFWSPLPKLKVKK